MPVQTVQLQQFPTLIFELQLINKRRHANTSWHWCLDICIILQEEGAEDQEDYEDEDLVDKAEKDFYHIIELEKKKQDNIAASRAADTAMEKGDLGKVSSIYD